MGVPSKSFDAKTKTSLSTDYYGASDSHLKTKNYMLRLYRGENPELEQYFIQKLS